MGMASCNTTWAIPAVNPVGNNVELSVKAIKLAVNPIMGRIVMAAAVLGRMRESCAVFVASP